MRAKEKYLILLTPMRERARSLGYALAVHGSLSRDIDIIACPWTDEAVPMQEFVASMIETIREHNGGIGYCLERNDELQLLRGHVKPHGRRAWSIQLGGTYIDLSVFPIKV